MAARLALCGLLATAALASQQPEAPLPRFRAGANLVTVDAYVTADGVPVTDLRPDEIEILEDGRPQAVEALRFVNARVPGGPTTSRGEPMGAANERAMAADPDARVFVLFFDTWHVSFDGSARSSAPVSEFLAKVIGPADLVGLMSPDLAARSMPLTRRTAAIERMVRDMQSWGERDKVRSADPRERELEMCYPDRDPRRPQLAGVAKELIERRREQKTLRALDDVVAHLSSVREDRKFVILLSEGWVQFRQNDRLAAALVPGSIPSLPPVGAGRDGRITAGQDPRTGDDVGLDSCERERSVLAFLDHSEELRKLAQRANRANVTFYAVDPRGLTPFDDSVGPLTPATPAADQARMSSRQKGLRELAEQTDGAVVLNTNDIRGGVSRIMGDLASYYLMGYYSTNTKLDGRYRRIAVRVKRPGVTVRARQGYLAPTEAEIRLASATLAPSLRSTATEYAGPRLRPLRRGPSTGLAYAAATEPRFRRTERLRVEVPSMAEGTTASARLLTRENQPMPLVVTFTRRVGAETNAVTGVADLALAPLAPGEYVLELLLEKDGQTQAATYRFQIIP